MTTPRTEQRCGNCYCFVLEPNDGFSGTCRANPPTASTAVPPVQQWPPTDDDEWCAKWLQGDQQ